MSLQYREGPQITVSAATAMLFARLVRFNATAQTVQYCGAGDAPNAVTIEEITAAGTITVRLVTSEGTFSVTAAKALAVGAVLYCAADGKVSDAVNGRQIGIALSAANADGERIEALLAPAFNLGDVINFTAGAALEADRLVKINSSNAIVYAGPGEDFVGTTLAAIANGAVGAVRHKNSPGQRVFTASAGTISVGAMIYADTDGKVTATVKGAPIGRANTGSTADNTKITGYLDDRVGRIVQVSRAVTSAEDTANVVTIVTGAAGAVSVGPVQIRNTSGVTRNPAGAVAQLTPGTITVTDANLFVDETIALTYVV